MKTFYFLDEPDAGSPDTPLHGPRSNRLYDSRAEAEADAERVSRDSGIYFQVWEHRVEDDAQVQRVAKMLAAAYWRGRFSVEIDLSVMDAGTFEAVIDAASESEKERWIAAARVAIGNDGMPPQG